MGASGMLRKRPAEVAGIANDVSDWEEPDIELMRRTIALIERTLEAERRKLRIAEQRVDAGRC